MIREEPGGRGEDIVTITAGIVELTKWQRLTLIRQELLELGEWIRQDFWAESTSCREDDDRAMVRSRKVHRANSTREDRNSDEDEGRKSVRGKLMQHRHQWSLSLDRDDGEPAAPPRESTEGLKLKTLSQNNYLNSKNLSS